MHCPRPQAQCGRLCRRGAELRCRLHRHPHHSRAIYSSRCAATNSTAPNSAGSLAQGAAGVVLDHHGRLPQFGPSSLWTIPVWPWADWRHTGGTVLYSAGGNHRQQRQDHGKGNARGDPAAEAARKQCSARHRGQPEQRHRMPLTLLRLRPSHRYAVIEMGMNHPGEIDYLTRIAKPDVALINNAQLAHIGLLGSVDGDCPGQGRNFPGPAERRGGDQRR